MLKESKKSRFDIDSAGKSVLIISHNTFRDCRVQIFSNNLSRKSCIWCFRVTDLDDCDFKVHFQVSKQHDFHWVHYRHFHERERLTCLFIPCEKLFTSFFRFSSCVWQGTVNCTTTVSKGLWNGLRDTYRLCRPLFSKCDEIS